MNTIHQDDPSEKSGQNIPPKPVPLLVIADAIPDQLKEVCQWGLWRYAWDDDAQKWTKPPLTRIGNLASSTNPKTWDSFEKAYQTYLKSQDQPYRFDGLGFFLLPKNLMTGFDLDHCRDPQTGEVKPWAVAIVHQAQTYWERSPSATGLRGFGLGHKPGSRCRNDEVGFEMYQSARFLCITGHHLDGTPATIEPIQEAIDAIYHQQFPPQTFTSGNSPNGSNGTFPEYPDDIIMDAARREKHAAEIVALYDHGDIRNYTHPDGSPYPSRADAALLRRLAFYSKHEEQLDRLFRLSALNRSKWEGRADYRHRTITFAIKSTPDQWTGPKPHVSDEEEAPYHSFGRA